MEHILLNLFLEYFHPGEFQNLMEHPGTGSGLRKITYLSFSLEVSEDCPESSLNLISEGKAELFSFVEMPQLIMEMPFHRYNSILMGTPNGIFQSFVIG